MTPHKKDLVQNRLGKWGYWEGAVWHPTRAPPYHGEQTPKEDLVPKSKLEVLMKIQDHERVILALFNKSREFYSKARAAHNLAVRMQQKTSPVKTEYTDEEILKWLD